jgi:hypothetical protein
LDLYGTWTDEFFLIRANPGDPWLLRLKGQNKRWQNDRVPDEVKNDFPHHFAS